jgi:hypothetical protein
MAGAFHSELQVDSSDRRQLVDGIEKVLSSFSIDGRNVEQKDQILVQRMVANVSMSGVLMTQELTTGAPYYVINYDDETGRTDTVSSGSYFNRTLMVHRESVDDVTSPRFVSLLSAAIEIEEIVECSNLDIEFSVNASGAVQLLQVRLIATNNQWDTEIAHGVNHHLRNLANDLVSLASPPPGVLGRKTVYGYMPDWNPAEMIGISPRPLASSLYRQLITDRTWRQARSEMGYRSVTGQPLMKIFCGHPYIDVRLSLNSFLPSRLDDCIGEKLVDSWIDRLQKNPQLHDKVEFEVAETCYALDLSKEGSSLSALTDDERGHFIYTSKMHTLELINGKLGSIDEQYNKLDVLEGHRGKFSNKVTDILALAEACASFGTLPFAILARHAFIAERLLRSLVRIGVLDVEEVLLLKQSIRTVTTEFKNHIVQLHNDEITADYFFKTYGHLRPGTYDITSQRYDQIPLDMLVGEPKSKSTIFQDFNVSGNSLLKLEAAFKSAEMEVSPERFVRYAKDAIRGREFGKFVFTRSLSDCLETIAGWGASEGFSREELSFLDFDLIKDRGVLFGERDLSGLVCERIKAARKNQKLYEAIRLPHLIATGADTTVVPLLVEQPNFVSRSRVHGQFLELGASALGGESLSGKIVLMPSADPGYDWVFSHEILGLITKFGGANSHMSIRCTEFGVPAAIGCGEQIYERLKLAQSIDLDCRNQKVIPI